VECCHLQRFNSGTVRYGDERPGFGMYNILGDLFSKPEIGESLVGGDNVPI